MIGIEIIGIKRKNLSVGVLSFFQPVEAEESIPKVVEDGRVIRGESKGSLEVTQSFLGFSFEKTLITSDIERFRAIIFWRENSITSLGS